MVSFAPQSERCRHTVLGKQLAFVGDQFSQAILSELDGHHVRQAHNPDLGMIEPLLDVLYLVNPEQFRMKRSLIKVKMKLVYALFRLALLHRSTPV